MHIAQQTSSGEGVTVTVTEKSTHIKSVKRVIDAFCSDDALIVHTATHN